MGYIPKELYLKTSRYKYRPSGSRYQLSIRENLGIVVGIILILAAIAFGAVLTYLEAKAYSKASRHEQHFK